jgi:hypothetical protein
MQHAAREMIAAAHDALDMLDGAVTTADLGEMLDALSQLKRVVAKRPHPPAAQTDPPSTGDPRPARPRSTVQRISVR